MPIRDLYASDELQYESFARAAPHLPHVPVSAAAAQRLGPHWVVGVLALATGIGLHTVYRVAAAACLLALTLVLVRLAAAFALPDWAAAVAIGLALANPYNSAYLLIAPAMLSDCLLVLGVAIALLGLVEERPWLAVAGCVLGTLGRETALPVAVGVALWLALRRRPAPGLAALVAPAFTFALLKVLAEPASLPNPSAGSFTVLTPISRLPGTARELAAHFLRVALAFPVALALLVASLLVLRRLGRLRPTAPGLAASLFLAGLVVLQPVVFNPDWVQHNETRLAALGVVPLAFAAAAALVAVPISVGRGAKALLIGGTALASLHHRYTWGGLVETRWVFLFVEAAVALTLGILVLVRARGELAPARAEAADGT